MSMESDINYPLLRNNTLLRSFDILMTYRLDSDVPVNYASRNAYGSFLDPPFSWAEKSRTGALAAYITSNPVCHRDRYVQELMRYISIDALGSCLNNKRLPEFPVGRDAFQRGGWNAIRSVLGRYKFYIALENSITEDYVTERFYHALAAGSVPLYRGAPNIADFAPHETVI